MVGGRVTSAGVASGAEGLLSRLIGMRLLGASRVTRWGLFLRREGFPSVAPGSSSLFLFITLGFAGSSWGLLRWWVGKDFEVHMMMTNIRVKH